MALLAADVDLVLLVAAGDQLIAIRVGGEVHHPVAGRVGGDPDPAVAGGAVGVPRVGGDGRGVGARAGEVPLGVVVFDVLGGDAIGAVGVRLLELHGRHHEVAEAVAVLWRGLVRLTPDARRQAVGAHQGHVAHLPLAGLTAVGAKDRVARIGLGTDLEVEAVRVLAEGDDLAGGEGDRRGRGGEVRQPLVGVGGEEVRPGAIGHVHQAARLREAGGVVHLPQADEVEGVLQASLRVAGETFGRADVGGGRGGLLGDPDVHRGTAHRGGGHLAAGDRQRGAQATREVEVVGVGGEDNDVVLLVRRARREGVGAVVGGGGEGAVGVGAGDDRLGNVLLRLDGVGRLHLFRLDEDDARAGDRRAGGIGHRSGEEVTGRRVAVVVDAVAGDLGRPRVDGGIGIVAIDAGVRAARVNGGAVAVAVGVNTSGPAITPAIEPVGAAGEGAGDEQRPGGHGAKAPSCGVDLHAPSSMRGLGERGQAAPRGKGGLGRAALGEGGYAVHPLSSGHVAET